MPIGRHGHLSFPVKELDPFPVLEAAIDGESGVGALDASATTRQVRTQLHNLPAGTFNHTESSLKTPSPIPVVVNPRAVGSETVDASGHGFACVEVGHECGNDRNDLSSLQIRLGCFLLLLSFRPVLNKRSQGGAPRSHSSGHPGSRHCAIG